jgi:hypothetical protein
MTIQETLARVDCASPNQYTRAQKMQWLSYLEGLLYDEIVRWHVDARGIAEMLPAWPYKEETPDETVLLLPAPHDALYEKYLLAQVDLANAEIVRYNNSITVFNGALAAFAAAYNRNNLPAQPARVQL